MVGTGLSVVFCSFAAIEAIPLKPTATRKTVVSRAVGVRRSRRLVVANKNAVAVAPASGSTSWKPGAWLHAIAQAVSAVTRDARMVKYHRATLLPDLAAIQRRGMVIGAV
jgi:hypothetical protein